MRLKNLEINGFKSFAKKTVLDFENRVVAIVGPNGSGKSNVVEALRFVLGEQSIKSMRGGVGSDLIFKGSKSLPKGSRASVTISFDNQDKVFKLSNDTGEDLNLNYDTISISREVYSDSLNKYVLNNSEVRLKDINNLLSSVNVGSSGHHIISQGEADRILNASSKDRREMIEDALGLKIYQYKIKEANRKLDRTMNNMKEVSMLRRENAPHLNFLKKQVDKFEKAKEMREELLSLYKEYLKKESIYLEKERNVLFSEKNEISKEIEYIKPKLEDTKIEEDQQEIEKRQKLKNLENNVFEIRSVKNEIERKLGRIEGILEAEEKRVPEKVEISKNVSVSREEFEIFFREANEYLEEAMYMDVLENIAPLLGKIKDILNGFAKNFNQKNDFRETNNVSNLEELKNTKLEISNKLEEIKKEENKILEDINILRSEIEKRKEDIHIREKEKFDFRVKYQELISKMNLLLVKEDSLNKENDEFLNEIKEGSVLVGNEILSYKNFEIEEQNIDKLEQIECKRKIERIKIKLEDIGQGSSMEVMKEYENMVERDAFLTKEMEDLSKSIESLRLLMSDLKQKIDFEFKEGIKKINIEFDKFFSIMFDGGSGQLSVVTENKKKKDEDIESEEEIVFEQGIEINVSLPHKKVKELNALSGGERSLTSIALLFAMSQVNPPPFLVLDETDAALDEANSRKYGDMLEKLSHHSQLIVVTHNRETMSRAGVLYGVTVGVDGASKLLSVKLEEATLIAK